MVFTMPVCANADRPATAARRTRPWVRGILLGVLAYGTPALADGIKVAQVQPQLLAERLVLNGTLDIGLSSKVEEALNNGIPLQFVAQVRLHRRRALIWDQTFGQWEFRRELRYHALSDQYLLTTERDLPQQRQSFETLAEALTRVTTLNDVSLSLSPGPTPEGDYRVSVRVHLDIEALPPVLRPVAYTSRAWDLNSGWTTWNVQR